MNKYLFRCDCKCDNRDQSVCDTRGIDKEHLRSFYMKNFMN